MPEHIPVLVDEVMAFFAPDSSSRLLDATLGLGGHSEAFLQASSPGGLVVGLEADEKALAVAQKRLEKFTGRTTLLHTNFFRVKDSIQGGGILTQEPPFTHVLFDLGIGSHQLADSERGFSFSSAAPLMMKFDRDGALPPSSYEPLNMLEARLGHPPDALEIIRQLSEQELTYILRAFGEEKYARWIAHALHSASPAPLTAQEVAQVIQSAQPAKAAAQHIHPATRTFQALRIAVNRELEALTAALPAAVDLLQPGGKLAVISFHSLEDRIVKRFLREEAIDCICPPQQPMCTCGHTARLKVVTKRPVTATEAEIARNPRSRSAKLRLAEKLPP
jgi:16S rRNA (cytosine1402-N4)-methyltransferase